MIHRCWRTYCVATFCFVLPMVTAYAQGPAELTAAIKRQLEIGSESPAPQFQYALSDLNGDGKDDAVVLISDNEYCGSGGCNLQVVSGGVKMM